MRKQATEAQKQAAAERRKQLQKLHKDIAAMSLEQRQVATGGGIFNADGSAYSLVNTLMIAIQIPGATVVAGFVQWRGHGRAVRKGVHGAGIFVPMNLKERDASGEPTADGKEFTTFTVRTVFDVSQTDAIADVAEAA